MAGYRMGLVIKMTREAEKISQEELAYDICSVESLSRIENEKQKPKTEIYKQLMEKMGREPERNYAELDLEDFELLDMKVQLDNCLHFYQFEKARLVWDILEEKLNKESKINRQYLKSTRTSLDFYEKYIGAKQYLNELLDALYETLPFYNEIYKGKMPYWREEIQILLNLSYAYSEIGDLENAIKITEELEKVLGLNYMYGKIAAGMYVNVIMSMGKYMGLLNKHDLAIQIAQKGIYICKEEKIGSVLERFIYGIGWNKEKMSEQENLTESEKKYIKSLFKKAYYISCATDNDYISVFIKKHVDNMEY